VAAGLMGSGLVMFLIGSGEDQRAVRTVYVVLAGLYLLVMLRARIELPTRSST
jgi:hypothetical protein